jgi:hypothetical protein
MVPSSGRGFQVPNNTYVRDLCLLEYFAVSGSKYLPTFRRHYDISKDGTCLSADMVQHPRWIRYSNTAVRIWKVIIIIVLSPSCSRLSRASFGLALRPVCLTIHFWSLFFPHAFCMTLATVSKSSLFKWHCLWALRILFISVHNFLYLIVYLKSPLTLCYRVVPQVCLVVHIISSIDLCVLFRVRFR